MNQSYSMLKKRRFRILVSCLKLLLLFLIPCSEGEVLAKSERPNVLFIAVDDLNEWVGYLGTHPDVKTPNLDRLAKRGVAFTRAYTTAPACNPSRASVLSGLRPSTTGIYHNNDAWGKSPALADSVQLPEHFRREGYHTLWAGKLWHTSATTQPPVERLDAMWDEMKNREGGYGPFPKDAGVEHPPLKGGFFDYQVWDGPDKAFADVRNAEHVIRFLGSKLDKPFFVGLGFFRPHNPWTVPRRFFEMYDPENISLPQIKEGDVKDLPPAARRMVLQNSPNHKELVDAGLWKPLVHAYLASISFMDAQLGKVLDALEKSPHAKNTIIVLWSDHGFHHGEKERWTKFALWEITTRSPLIICVPGMKNSGKRVETPVSLLDLYPTLVDLAGLPKPAHKLEGQSLKGQLENPVKERDVPAITTYGQNNHAIRHGNWRYIQYENGDEELYNLTDDPNEWDNLAGRERFATVTAKMKKMLPQLSVPSAEDAARRPRRQPNR